MSNISYPENSFHLKGYYCHGNFGDDLLMKVSINILTQLGFNVFLDKRMSSFFLNTDINVKFYYINNGLNHNNFFIR